MSIRLLACASFLFLCVACTAQTWQQLPDFPGTARDDAASFVAGGKIYVGTGFEVGFNLTNDWWCFDPTTEAWSAVAPMPTTGRQYCTGFNIADTGYVFGGLDANGALAELWSYHPDTDQWQQRAPIPAEARYASVAVEGFYTNAIVATGMLASGMPTNEAWKYDTDTDAWQQIAPVPGPSRHRAACFLDDGGMRIVGGADSLFNALSDSWSYPIWFETGLWYTAPALPEPRYGADGSGGHVSILTAGASGSSFNDDTWLLWGADWIAIAPFAGGPRRGGVGASGSTAQFWNVEFYYGLGLDSSLQRHNDWWRLVQPVGIAENSALELLCHPNPVNDLLQLPGTRPNDRMRIVDAVGREYIIPFAGVRSLDVSRLAPGVYSVVVTDSAGRVRTARFVKE